MAECRAQIPVDEKDRTIGMHICLRDDGHQGAHRCDVVTCEALWSNTEQASIHARPGRDES